MKNLFIRWSHVNTVSLVIHLQSLPSFLSILYKEIFQIIQLIWERIFVCLSLPKVIHEMFEHDSAIVAFWIPQSLQKLL